MPSVYTSPKGNIVVAFKSMADYTALAAKHGYDAKKIVGELNAVNPAVPSVPLKALAAGRSQVLTKIVKEYAAAKKIDVVSEKPDGGLTDVAKTNRSGLIAKFEGKYVLPLKNLGRRGRKAGTSEFAREAAGISFEG